MTTRAGEPSREVFGGGKRLKPRGSLIVVVRLDVEVDSVEDMCLEDIAQVLAS